MRLRALGRHDTGVFSGIDFIKPDNLMDRKEGARVKRVKSRKKFRAVGSSRPLSIVSYVFTIGSILLILFPLFLMGSYSVRDAAALNRFPPDILPECTKSVELVLDYSSLEEGQDLEETMRADAIFAMYALSTEFNDNAVGEIKVYGQIDGKTVFYQRQHNTALQVQLDYGAYRNVSKFDRKTLVESQRYQKALDVTDFTFDPNGIDKAPKADQQDLDGLSSQMTGHLTDEEKGFYLNGEIVSISLHKNPLLMLETFKYYFDIVKYMYPNEANIQKYSLFAFLFNTLIVMGWAVLTQIGLCSITAYSLSRLFSRRMSKILMMFFLITMMIPFMCIVLPQMIMMKGIDSLNNYRAMLLPYLYPSAFYIFLFKGFFDQLPQDLLDAARIDGASQFYTFTRICMPLSKSITALLVLNVLVSAWNDFYWYLRAANRTNLWTINLALYNISNNPMSKTNVTMGIAFLTILPVILLTIVFQRQIKESVISAGIKG